MNCMVGISVTSRCCDETLCQKQLKGKRVLSGSQLQITVHPCRKVKLAAHRTTSTVKTCTQAFNETLTADNSRLYQVDNLHYRPKGVAVYLLYNQISRLGAYKGNGGRERTERRRERGNVGWGVKTKT